jgi:stearoyl-CoA desaturase (delta-9 desaturase)
MVTVVSFYILNILGNWMTLHRYYAHKSFEFKNVISMWVFTLLSLLAGRGSPLGWSYLHRKHHMHSDTDLDPHSPTHLGYKLFGFDHYKKQEEEKMQIFIVKDLMSKEQLFIHKWYMIIILVFIIALAVISIELLYFAWLLPVFLVHLSQNNFNYFGHMYGYRNFVTKDDSKNNMVLFPFILGEAWHNNHHYNPKAYSTKIRKHEYDPVSSFIEIIKK